jgi:hypothetical protein
MSKTYIITGRVPDRDNETLWFQAKSYADAVSQFIKLMHQDDPDEKKRIVNDHGVAVYLDCVVEATGEFDVHLSAGWQEMSDEAKKYRDRKTAYER